MNCGYMTSGVILAAMLIIAGFQPSVSALLADVIEKAADELVSILRAHAAARYAARAAYKSVYRHFRPEAK